LLDLAGQIQFSSDYDHKNLRAIRRAVNWYLCLG
jgi:hypothetical protein